MEKDKVTEKLLCHKCDRETSKEDSTKIEGNRYCIDCVDEYWRTCDYCDGWVEADDRRWAGDVAYCIDCHVSLFTSCDSCNDTISVDEVYSNDEGRYCESCYDEESVSIHDYSYKPQPIFNRASGETKNNSFTIGIELETENKKDKIPNDTAAQKVTEIMNGLVYCKTDGSLNNGFEMVSHPMTEAWLKGHKKRYVEALEYLRSEGFKSYETNTCGIHIHISKDSFTTFHLYRFMKFFYDNKPFILFLSQRKESQFTAWARLNDIDRKTLMRRAKDKYNNGERYQAINLTEHTAEIRIFRGTLKEESFFKNTEFIFSLHKYTKENNADAITVSKYLDYIKENRNKYRNLYTWLRGKTEVLKSMYNYNIE